jgi:hypothetical protein
MGAVPAATGSTANGDVTVRIADGDVMALQWVLNWNF